MTAPFGEQSSDGGDEAIDACHGRPANGYALHATAVSPCSDRRRVLQSPGAMRSMEGRRADYDDERIPGCGDAIMARCFDTSVVPGTCTEICAYGTAVKAARL